MRTTCFKFCPRTVQSERPITAFTQPFARLGKDRMKSTEITFAKVPTKNE
jgi:hypothetical protein